MEVVSFLVGQCIAAKPKQPVQMVNLAKDVYLFWADEVLRTKCLLLIFWFLNTLLLSVR